jgi:hypothetical protein
MDTREVQRWGVLIGGFAIAGALLIASRTEPSETRPAPPKASVSIPSNVPESGTPTASPAKANPAPSAPLFEPASDSANATAGNVSFVVRFQPTHPLGRAQNLEQQGRHSDATRTARATIAGRTDLRGLCFDRFTLGGAEIVLRACDSVPAAQRENFQRNWTRRLGAMNGVEYAEPNYTAYPEKGR